MNDEPVSHEDIPSPSVSEELASSQTRPLNSSFKVREPSERLSRKEKSAIQKFLPPVLGGLAALPLATAILWYGFGKDIGGIGPAVAQYTPWIVPKKLRGSGFRSDGTFSSRNSGSSSNSDHKIGTLPEVSSKQMPADGFKSALPSLGSMSPPANSQEIALPKSDDAADAGLAEKPEFGVSPSVAIDKLSLSIQDLIDLKEKWPSIPRERAVQMKAVSDFYGCLCEIAQWSDSPDDGISELWNQHRGSIASMILEDNKFSALTQRCATGEIANVVSLESSGYLVSVIPSGFPLKEKESVDGEKNLTLETVIAGNLMTVDFPSSDEELAAKVKIMEPGRPLLLFLRIEKQADAVTLTAFDCMNSPSK